MKYAVYWQPDDIECCFFKTEDEARAKVASLIKENENLWDGEGSMPFWDITLLKVMGEVEQIPYDGSLALRRVA